jgi:hypothetical protein
MKTLELAMSGTTPPGGTVHCSGGSARVQSPSCAIDGA